MITYSKITPTLPMTDMEKSKAFYEGKLGLTPSKKEIEPDSLMYEGTDGSCLYLYKRPATNAPQTVASLAVDDLEKAVDELVTRGVVFEHYDMPGIKTNEKGIVDMNGMKAAWLKDPDGNILSLMQMR